MDWMLIFYCHCPCTIRSFPGLPLARAMPRLCRTVPIMQFAMHIAYAYVMPYILYTIQHTTSADADFCELGPAHQPTHRHVLHQNFIYYSFMNVCNCEMSFKRMIYVCIECWAFAVVCLAECFRVFHSYFFFALIFPLHNAYLNANGESVWMKWYINENGFALDEYRDRGVFIFLWLFSGFWVTFYSASKHLELNSEDPNEGGLEGERRK